MNKNESCPQKQPEEPRAAMFIGLCSDAPERCRAHESGRSRHADLPGRLGLGSFSRVRAASLSHERCHIGTDSGGHIGLSNTLTGMNVDR